MLAGNEDIRSVSVFRGCNWRLSTRRQLQIRRLFMGEYMYPDVAELISRVAVARS